jgi:predicted permease
MTSLNTNAKRPGLSISAPVEDEMIHFTVTAPIFGIIPIGYPAARIGLVPRAGVIILILPDFNANLKIAAIIVASAPMLAIYPVIGDKYGMAQEGASKLLFTTVASFITISKALWRVN